MVNNSYGPYDSIKPDTNEQWIRLSEGCPNHCKYCKEPREQKLFPIPPIVRNSVKIMDMNFLSKLEALERIKFLGSQKVDSKVVYYELVCGIDYRFLTQEIAVALKQNRFIRMRIAWDWEYAKQWKIKKAIDLLLKAGYVRKELMVFMICNWKIPFVECMRKLNLCKYWNVKVSDCYFDGQTMPNAKPLFWSAKKIKMFRHEVRKHNQMVLFGLDPELREDDNKLFRWLG